jgi:hypothetical protein
MADNLTNAGENLALDFLLGTSPASTRYVGLFTAAPGEGGGGTEVSGGSYARQALTAAAAASGAADNSAEISFPAASADWGTVTYVGIFSASTAGTRIAYAPLASSKTVVSGNTLKFAVSALDFTAA